jgi:hypothetical protein
MQEVRAMPVCNGQDRKKNKKPRPYGEGFCNADKEGSRYGKSGRGTLVHVLAGLINAFSDDSDRF